MTTKCGSSEGGVLKFLGATVLSFNSSLGLGSQESSLNIDVIEDLDDGDAFLPLTDNIKVGAPVYFTAGEFTFGGVLSSWNGRQSTSGKTFNVKISDPRQLLQNAVVVVDSYAGPPIQSSNYFNAYAFYEQNIYNGVCATFGSSGVTSQGMPYSAIIAALQNMNPAICSPTGYIFYIDFSSFPQGVPQYYRVPGPSVTILQLLQDVCDVLGYDFYVNLINDTITIGLIDLKNPPTSFDTIVGSYEGSATELSYGQELRNEITKSVLVGEKVHYLTQINTFYPFFGIDVVNGSEMPVIPYGWDANGFWISKTTADLQLGLHSSFGTGPYQIHELDIRAAMTSFKAWVFRVSNGAPGSFNNTIRQLFNQAIRTNPEIVANFIFNAEQLRILQQNLPKGLADRINNPDLFKTKQHKPDFLEDLEAIHSWLANLGNTYYGKQYFCPLNENVCYYISGETGEFVFSSDPTKEGGWVDPGLPVLGLTDPDLEVFREQDGRINAFALFRTDGEAGEVAQDLYMPSQGAGF